MSTCFPFYYLKHRFVYMQMFARFGSNELKNNGFCVWMAQFCFHIETDWMKFGITIPCTKSIFMYCEFHFECKIYEENCVFEFTHSWIKSLTTRLNNSNIDYYFMDMNQTIPKPMFNVSLVHLVNQYNEECMAFSPFCKLWCSNNYVTIWIVNRSTSMCTFSI